jgi:hypothetical protein
VTAQPNVLKAEAGHGVFVDNVDIKKGDSTSKKSTHIERFTITRETMPECEFNSHFELKDDDDSDTSSEYGLLAEEEISGHEHDDKGGMSSELAVIARMNDEIDYDDDDEGDLYVEHGTGQPQAETHDMKEDMGKGNDDEHSLKFLTKMEQMGGPRKPPTNNDDEGQPGDGGLTREEQETANRVVSGLYSFYHSMVGKNVSTDHIGKHFTIRMKQVLAGLSTKVADAIVTQRNLDPIFRELGGDMRETPTSVLLEIEQKMITYTQTMENFMTKDGAMMDSEERAARFSYWLTENVYSLGNSDRGFILTSKAFKVSWLFVRNDSQYMSSAGESEEELECESLGGWDHDNISDMIEEVLHEAPPLEEASTETTSRSPKLITTRRDLAMKMQSVWEKNHAVAKGAAPTLQQWMSVAAMKVPGYKKLGAYCQGQACYLCFMNNKLRKIIDVQSFGVMVPKHTVPLYDVHPDVQVVRSYICSRHAEEIDQDRPIKLPKPRTVAPERLFGDLTEKAARGELAHPSAPKKKDQQGWFNF